MRPDILYSNSVNHHFITDKTLKSRIQKFTDVFKSCLIGFYDKLHLMMMGLNRNNEELNHSKYHCERFLASNGHVTTPWILKLCGIKNHLT